jgi:hypothetical protein
MNGPSFEQILDECVEAIRRGQLSVEECLARHPAERSQLQLLLEASARFMVADSVQPSSAVLRRSRQRLDSFTRAHPRRPQPRLVPFFRMAGVVTAVMLAFLVPVTVRAQSALPQDSLYPWKLLTERIWHSFAPDPVGVDLQVADRRVEEFVALGALQLLSAESTPEDQERITSALTEHNELLGAVEPLLPPADSGSTDGESQDLLPDLDVPVLPDLLP